MASYPSTSISKGIHSPKTVGSMSANEATPSIIDTVLLLPLVFAEDPYVCTMANPSAATSQLFPREEPIITNHDPTTADPAVDVNILLYLGAGSYYNKLLPKQAIESVTYVRS